MKIKIHRGTHEIGGTCVEITADNGKTLLVDFGSPLSMENPNIGYAKDLKADALLISHAHQDHYGLLVYLVKYTHTYIGETSLGLINIVRGFLNEKKYENNITTFSPWKTFEIENTFKIFPYLVDHSSPEAFSFIIEADNKRVFYSGDFRATGYKKKVFSNMIENPPKNIDLMFIEGTMAKRDNQKFKTEEQIFEGMCEVFKQQTNISFVISSAQNIDRFVSVYKACRKANKTVVVDIYNSLILDLVKKNSPSLPVIEWANIKVFNHPSQKQKITEDELLKRFAKEDVGDQVFHNPSNFVYFVRLPNEKLIEVLKRKGGKINVIYSQWEGYLKEEHKMYFTDYINQLKESDFVNFHYMHTSGHATIDVLIKLAKVIKPSRLVPIHTEYPEQMKTFFQDAHLNTVEIWEDNYEYII